MPWITEMRLTSRGRSLVRDSHRTHQVLTGAAEGRVMWSLPEPDLLIAQADRVIRPDDMRGIVRFAASAEKRLDYLAGARLEMAGIVNPTQAVSRPGQRSRIQALTPHGWPEWAARKLGAAIAVEHVDIRHHRTHGGNRQGSRVVHALASLRAVGAVRDPEALAGVLRDGIGRGKAYGAGLILAWELT